jgi:AsmA protein
VVKKIKIRLSILTVVVVLIGGGVTYISTLELNSYKGAIQEEVKKATVRDLVITGDIGLESWLTVSSVRFQNSPWGPKPDMVAVGALGVMVALMPRFSKKIKVQRVVSKDVKPPLETDDCSTA